MILCRLDIYTDEDGNEVEELVIPSEYFGEVDVLVLKNVIVV